MQAPYGPAADRQRLRLLLVAYLAFVGLGLPDTVTGVAWPSIRDAFGSDQGGLGVILSGAATGYLASSLMAGGLVRSLGFGRLLAASSALVALALAGCATTGLWPVFVLCAVALGAGGGAIDAALNLFVATVFGARQLNWLHAFYGVGAALGPMLMTAVLAVGWSWRWGYVTIALVLAALALFYAATRRVWSTASRRTAAPPDDAPAGRAVTARQVLRIPSARLHIAAFFVLTGIEATAGQWSYTVLTEARGLDPATAGTCVGGFWTLFTLGRVAAGVAVVRLGALRVARIAAAGVVAGVLLFALAPAAAPLSGAAGLWLAGFSIGPLFPGLMAETPRRLGAGAAAHAVGFQVAAAVVGAAALPAVAGSLTGPFGLGAIAAVLVPASLVFLALHERIIATADR
jgi:fucose permease